MPQLFRATAYRAPLGFVTLPQPAQAVRQNRAPVPVAVEAMSKLEFEIVLGEGQRFSHLLVGQGPVAMQIVEVVFAVLKEDADRFRRSLADQRRIIVSAFAQRRPAGDVGKAADPRQNFAELIRALPGDGEGADAAAADAADGAAGGVVTQFVTLFDFRKDLFEQEPRVLIRERVVFKT